MKKLRELQGGYPRQQDYLLTVQNELFAMANGLFAKLGVDMVLKGCDITNNLNGTVNISDGIVYVSGEVMRFEGVNNVISNNSKTFIAGTPSNTSPVVFADGQSKEVYTEIKAIIGTKSSVTQIGINTQPLYNLATYIQDVTSSYAVKGEIKDIYDFDGTFLNNFDTSGLGVTARYANWALLNGNNGTPNAQGRVRLTVGTVTNPGTGLQKTFAHGSTGGETEHKLLLTELPKFRPTGNVPVYSNNDYDTGAGNNNVLARTKNGNQFTINYGFSCNEIGGDMPHNVMQPYLAVYTIIKIA